jgi:hypothetical protein
MTEDQINHLHILLEKKKQLQRFLDHKAMGRIGVCEICGMKHGQVSYMLSPAVLYDEDIVEDIFKFVSDKLDIINKQIDEL